MKIDPMLARGTLGGHSPPTPTREAYIVYNVPNTSYQLHLVPLQEVPSRAGARLIGVIRARARRVDIVQTGGKYVEPVAGRPRRVQGRVLGVRDGLLVVDAGVPIHFELTDPRQKPNQFEPGQFVSFDVMDGASFAPAQ